MTSESELYSHPDSCVQWSVNGSTIWTGALAALASAIERKTRLLDLERTAP